MGIKSIVICSGLILLASSSNGFFLSKGNLITQLSQAEAYELSKAVNTQSRYLKQSSSFSEDQIIFIPRDLTAKDDSPRDRKPGLVYGGNQCPSVNPPLTALVPGYEEVIDEVDGTTVSRSQRTLTTQANPDFWFYIPYDSSLNLPAEFVLKDDSNQIVYKNTYLLTTTPGIGSIQLPKNLELLEEGKDYTWFFSVICDSNDRASDISVNGRIQRVSTTVDNTILVNANPYEKAILYANDGLWNETLTILINEYRSERPQESSLLLSDILQAVELDEIPIQRITQCCSASDTTEIE